MVYAGLRAVIEDAGHFSVTHCSELSATAAPPACILIADMSGSASLDAVSYALRTIIEPAIIVRADHPTRDFAERARNIGARGILAANASVDACVACVRAVAGGEEYFDSVDFGTRAARLTTREHEVLSLLTQGLSNKEIAWRLQIAEGTVKAHLTGLFRKTGANDRFSLALHAIRSATSPVSNRTTLPAFVPESAMQGLRAVRA